MKLKQLGSNQTLLQYHQHEILFSYETPVAGYIKGKGYFKTDKHYSVTTTKHINEYLKGCENPFTLTSEEIVKLAQGACSGD